MKADVVFQGGGMRGIGIVGALYCLERHGYQWERVSGTSVGAVIASLIAAGYKAKEMGKILTNTDFTKFMDKDGLQRFPLLGRLIGLFRENALYSGDYMENWIGELLKFKGVEKFKDVSVNGVSRLKIVASDITRNCRLILPDDLENYGIDPMEFSIARAVRMSSSIPFYFKPVKLQYQGGISYIVDGGIAYSFPIEIFDTNDIPKWPTFGFKFDSTKASFTSKGKTDLLSFLFDIASTMSRENEAAYLRNENQVRTVIIPSEGVEATEFDISKQKGHKLFMAGYRSALEFMKKWDFDEYVRKYRVK